LDGLLGFVCVGIMLVPVGTDVEGGLVDGNTGSELDPSVSSSFKAIHDPTLGPWGVGRCGCRRGC
jgi:hypothetical protein